MWVQLIRLVFDGLAYGSLLFLMSVGLSVSLGLMNVVNLAHGVFALLGGYLFIYLLQSFQWPWVPSLVLVFCLLTFFGWVSEFFIFNHLYRLPPLKQVLLTLGICFIVMAVTMYFFGPNQQFLTMPRWLSGQMSVFGVSFGAYRLFLILLVSFLSFFIWLGIERTRFGLRLRAAVDNSMVAKGLGVPVNQVFRWCFALGAGLGGLGGALSTAVLGIAPDFVLKYLVIFLMVVVLGGGGTLRGPLLAAVAIGLIDVFSKYF